MNHGGRFGLSEKYRLCHKACNYCPDYPDSAAALAAALDAPVAQIVALRKASFILGCMFLLFQSGLF